MGALSPLDPSSFSRPELAVMKHMSISLNVDFEKKVLNGIATLNFDVLENIEDVVLDSSNLIIEGIESEDGSQLQYKVDDPVPNFGSKLTITLPKRAASGGNDTIANEVCIKLSRRIRSSDGMTLTEFMYAPIVSIKYDKRDKATDSMSETDSSCGCCECKKTIENRTSFNGNRLKIKIKYSTSPTASALQWLDPAQTSGKKHPYLFSQCQPIHARSIVPCQDTPAVKFTYDAEVSAPEEFTVLMSALRGEARSNKTSFSQPMPLPAYLIALAVGVLESRNLGPRSKVWSEKEEIERSAWEFAETEKYLQAAEKLCGPYEWTQYDLLVLPPSFPYGGDADFYPNGGMKQPGCFNDSNSIWSRILPISPSKLQQAICSHGRAYLLFTESLVNNNCSFRAFRWNLTYEGVNASIRATCNSRGSCSEMGIKAVGINGLPQAQGPYFTLTTEKEPYCPTESERQNPVPELLRDLRQGFRLDRAVKDTTTVTTEYADLDEEDNEVTPTTQKSWFRRWFG